MSDQATELRKLVLRSAREISASAGPPTRLVVMTGGKGGVGVTTLSVQLAMALAEQGSRVVLVDADLQRADVASLCGLPEQRNVADVLTSRSDIHEVLVRGPGGILVVPGLWAPGSASAFTEASQLRLIKQLRQLGRHADIVLIDVGSGSHDVVRRFWQAANNVVMVTTPDPVAVMDCYATIKSMLSGENSDALRLIVNRVASTAVAEDVYQRIQQSCRRFMGVSLNYLGCAVDQPLPVISAAGETRPVPHLSSVPDDIARIATTLLTEKFTPTYGMALGRKAA